MTDQPFDHRDRCADEDALDDPLLGDGVRRIAAGRPSSSRASIAARAVRPV